MSYDINEEWKNFISSGHEDDDISDDELVDLNTFIQKDEELISANLSFDFNSETPKASDIYISTKTKLGYLNRTIDLNSVFWAIPVIPYARPCNGVIKKQKKFNSLTPEDLEYIKEKLKFENYFEEHIITSINNPAGRIKFKDLRKVSVGISKKDIMSYRSKKKSAFYNCFVMIVRILVDQTYKEFHVKIFNTGKIEIPGIQSETVFQMLLKLVITILQPHIPEQLEYNINSEETVLINSNFNCGFFINREILYDTLKFKYNIQSIYDPCSYPGIQCKFYYNPDLENQIGSQISEENKKKYKNVKEVSFMIFRTGSVLIVGRCDESVLMIIYEFLKIILNNEYKQICQKNIKLNGEPDILQFKNKDKDKKKKIRRKNITVSI
jgi:TATA-box binding protein (TBP) (component of TFIID and TFIIIB)